MPRIILGAQIISFYLRSLLELEAREFQQETMAVHLSESVDDFGELVLVADILDNAGGNVSFSFSTESSAAVATQACAYDPIGILFGFFAIGVLARNS